MSSTSIRVARRPGPTWGLLVALLAEAGCAAEAGPAPDPAAPIVTDVASVDQRTPGVPVVLRDPASPTAVAAFATVPDDRPLQIHVSVVAPYPVEAVVTVDGPGLTTPEVLGTGAGVDPTIRLVGLREETTYRLDVDVRASAVAPWQTIVLSATTGALPAYVGPAVARVEGKPEDPAMPDVLLTGTTRTRPDGLRIASYFAVDREGSLVWQYTDDDLPGSVTPLVRALPATGELALLLPGEIRWIDVFGDTRRRIPEDASWGGLHHDFEILPDGHVLLLGRENRTVSVPELGEVLVTGDLVVEVDALGAHVGTWRALDHLPSDRFPGPASRRRASSGGLDWSHANTVHYRPGDDSFLVSLRSQHWIVKVDRTSGEVDWILGPGGDFELEGAGEWFYAQHAPVWVEGGLLLYDNGVERPEAFPGAPPYSRVVAYELDETELVARQTFSWELPAFTPVVGDVDPVGGGRYLVTSGFPTIDGLAHVYLIDASGAILWSYAHEGSLYRSALIAHLRTTGSP